MKVFFIGLNKTGSTAFHSFFEKNGYKSLHSSGWWYYKEKKEFGNYDFFEDGYERLKGDLKFPDLELILRYFPDAKFVLNTRNIDTWIHSRLNHRIRDYLTKDLTKFDENLILDWVKNRNDWYESLFKFFTEKGKLNDLLIVNLEKEGDNVVKRLEDFLKLDFNDKQIDIVNKSRETDEKKQRNRWTVDKFLCEYVKYGYYTSDLEVKLLDKKR